MSHVIMCDGCGQPIVRPMAPYEIKDTTIRDGPRRHFHTRQCIVDWIDRERDEVTAKLVADGLIEG